VTELAARPIPVADTRPLRRAVLRPHLRLEEMDGSEAADAVAYGVHLNGALIAVGLVGPEGEPGDWRVRGMATAPEARGRGAGTAVLTALVAHARDSGARRVWCNARTPALSLYERGGFTKASDEFELPQTGPHYVMERRLELVHRTR
jgi:ribosomal protein S18 acetylase RimI-like enzyme